jgi:poly(3-hydroxybutyrate) depolymerase
MSTMLYYLYEMNHAAIAPWRAAADAGKAFWTNPANPMAHTVIGRSMAASLEMFERATRRFGKPAFGFTGTMVGDTLVDIVETPVLHKPFCTLLHFERQWPVGLEPKNPHKLLIVAPMSGHYATLLRGTVEAMLPHYDVYITDWVDARMAPQAAGRFDLDDYIDYVVEMLEWLGPNTSVAAVCQPSVPVLAAVSLMAQRKSNAQPKAMVLMGGPIDTRKSPTQVNLVAQARGVEWFEQNTIMIVPPPNAGAGRQVYPGFLQLSGFMAMNYDRHVDAHREMFWHLVDGDGDSAEKHTEFYDEYMSVMDLTAEFYLQTVEAVFVEHRLPNGTFVHRGALIDPKAITRTALMTVEGERDDISGVGQTFAAHALCSGLPEEKKRHLLQKSVGHYGVFNGQRYRSEIAPAMRAFIDAHRGA